MVDSTASSKQVSLTTSHIRAKNGQDFLLDFFHFPKTFKQALYHPHAPSVPHIVKLALNSFPHWTDNGDYFATELAKSKYLSLIKTNDGTIVGFSHYVTGRITLLSGKPATYMYAKYVAVDPAYRQIGLMRKVKNLDLLRVNPDIIAGCSAVGEIHQIIHKISDETGRVFYPTQMVVPEVIGEIAQSVYTAVYGRSKSLSINSKTLVRRGDTPYAQGNIDYSFFKKLNLDLLDGVMYISLTKTFAHSILPYI